MCGTSIKGLPADERPRERLIAGGAAAVSSAELLAILLGTGSRRGGSALELAQRLLAEAGGLRQLAAASAADLWRRKGIGPAKAVRLVAAFELGRRAAAEQARRAVIRGPADVAAVAGAALRDRRQEHFCVVLLNTRHHVLGIETVSVGSLDGTTVHPREVFREAIVRSAAAIALVHNHPSGDPTPSPDDIAVTGRLVEVGSLLGIPVVDHVVIGDGRYASLREWRPALFER